MRQAKEARKMKRLETIRLLMECDAGCKMAVSSIDDVAKKVKEDGLKKLLMENKALHKELESEVEGLLNDCGATEKAPAAVAKGMSWLKTNTKFNKTKRPTIRSFFIFNYCQTPQLRNP